MFLVPATNRRGVMPWEDEAGMDAAVRAATRNAPPAVKRHIDRVRRAEGRAPLWADELRSAERASGRRQRVDDLLANSNTAGILVGAACPGLSIPVACAHDGRTIPELIAVDAFRFSLLDIRAGRKNVWLANGHTTDAVAHTGDGTLRVWADDEVGLMVEARLPATDDGRSIAAEARMGKVGLSIGFRPQRMREIKVRGKWVRHVAEATLSHVALCRPGVATAAYRAARVYHAWGDQLSMDAARVRARLGAWAAIRSQRQGP